MASFATLRRRCDGLVLAASLAFAGVVLRCDAAAGAGAAPHPLSPPVAGAALVRTLIEQGRYPEAESAAVGLLASGAAHARPDSLAIAEWLELEAKAMACGGRYWLPEARAAADRSLDIRERVLGPDHLDVAGSLVALGMVLARADADSIAACALERAVRIREHWLGPDHVEVARALLELWRARIDLPGGDESADSVARRAAEICERSLPIDHPDRVASAAAVAYVAQAVRGSKDSTLYLAAIAQSERSLGPDHPLLAERLLWYSRLLRNLTRHGDANALIERAVAIYQRSLGENILTAEAIERMGVNLLWSGQLDSALRVLGRSLAMTERVIGPDHPDVAVPLLYIGDVLWREGDLAGARSRLERALAICERHLPPNDPTLTFALERLGEYYIHASEVERARRVLARALELRRARGDDVAAACDLLAQVTVDPARRRALYHEAALGYVRGASSTLMARGLGLLSEDRFADGDVAEALRLRERSNAIYDSLGVSFHEGLGWGLWSVSVLYEALGRHAEASRSLERALTIFEKAVGPEHWLTATARRYWAEQLARMNRSREAFAVARRAEETHRVSVSRNAHALPERIMLGWEDQFWGKRSEGLPLMLTLAYGSLRDDAATRREAWDGLIRSRAQVLDALGARHQARRYGADSSVCRLVAAYDSANRRLANLVVRGPGIGDGRAFATLWAEALHGRDAVEQTLAERSSPFNADRVRARAGFEDVTRALPPAAALVGYARVEPLDLAARSNLVTPRLPAIYVAFVTSSALKVATLHDHARRVEAGTTAVALVPLGSARRIDSLVTEWRALAGNRAGGTGGIAGERRYRGVGTRLRAAIWDPILPHLGNVTRVFVAPEGPLHLLNFASLPVGASEYLVERGPVIHTLATERDLVEPDAASHGVGLLALGAPEFDAEPDLVARATDVEHTRPGTYRGPHSSCQAFREARFGSLPRSRDEVEQVAGVWEKMADRRIVAVTASRAASTPVSMEGSRTTVVRLVGRDATEEEFKRRAPGHRVLHLATHGFFIDGTCPVKTDGSRGVGGLVDADSASQMTAEGEAPLLLSGLALAGANRRGEVGPDEEDGILTADEIAAMDLTGVDWAVLSACETGMGAVQAGEGVLGLRRAFRAAGVHTTIMSLWEADDEATRAWMAALYKARLERGSDTAAAARAASLEVLRARRRAGLSTHPYTWAAFIAAGDWR